MFVGFGVGGEEHGGVVLEDLVPVGTIDLSPLARRWELLDQLYAVTRDRLAAREPGILSPRLIDEGQPGGHRVYQVAERYLGVARDNHSAFVSLVLGDHGVSPSAPWNLLRPTFEASFYAAWVLDPDQSIERRARALRVEYLDELEHRRYYSELDDLNGIDQVQLAEVKADLQRRQSANEASYRTLAADLGENFPPRGVNVRDELGRLSDFADEPDGSAMLRATWRSLSGHQHGRISATLRSGDRTNERETPGGMHAIVSVNDDAFRAAADVTLSLHMCAVQLLLRRSEPRLHGS